MVNRVVYVLVCAVLLGVAPALGADKPGTATDTAEQAVAKLAEEGRQVFERFVDSIQRFEAKFEQVRFDENNRVVLTERGMLSIARPKQFRWEVSAPNELIVIADGVHVWNYEVDLDTVSVYDQSDSLGNTPADILSGNREALDAFDYAGAFRQQQIIWVQFQAKESDSDFQALRLGFDAEELVGMQLADRLGARTIVTFSDVDMDPEFAPDLFEFTPPEGVEVNGQLSSVVLSEDG
ncbi:MAG: outer membrane lipoprotein chaperone LolA [Pseudomonadota bacterium]